MTAGMRVRHRESEFFGHGTLQQEDDSLTGWWWVLWDQPPPRDYNCGVNPCMMPGGWLEEVPQDPEPADHASICAACEEPVRAAPNEDGEGIYENA